MAVLHERTFPPIVGACTLKITRENAGSHIAINISRTLQSDKSVVCKQLMSSDCTG